MHAPLPSRDPDEAHLSEQPILHPHRPETPLLRAKDLALLRESLARDRLAILRGRQSGAGATRLAAELAHEHLARRGRVVWLIYRWSSMREAAADVVDALKLRSAGGLRWPFVSPDNAIGTMWRELHGTDPLLIVLDGVRASDDMKRWLSPHAHVQVLGISEPRTAVLDDTYIHGLQSIEPSEIARVVSSAFPGASEEERRALNAFFADDALSADVAQALFTSGDPPDVGRWLDVERPAGMSPEPVLTAAISRLWSGDAAALQALALLRVLVLLDAEPVPLALLAAILSHSPDTSLTMDTLHDAVGRLEASRLVTRTTFGELVAPLRVLQVARDLFGETLVPWTVAVAAGLRDRFDAVPQAQLHARRRLAPHARRILAGDFEDRVDALLLAQVAAAVSVDDGGRQVAGVAEARKALELTRSVEASPGEKTLEAQMRLGWVLCALRQLPEAQDVYREAVALAERIHGADGLLVASALDGLARSIGLGVCGDAGPEAHALKDRALAIREKEWGLEDPRIVNDVTALGLRLAILHRPAEALPHFRRAVRLAEHGDPLGLAHCLNSLASTLGQLDELAEAVAVSRRALAVYRERGRKRQYAFSAIASVRHDLRGLAGRAHVVALTDEVLGWPEWDYGDIDQSETVGRIRAVRAQALKELGRHAEAVEEAERALPLMGPRLEGERQGLRKIVGARL